MVKVGMTPTSAATNEVLLNMEENGFAPSQTTFLMFPAPHDLIYYSWKYRSGIL